MTEFYPDVAAEVRIAHLEAELARWRKHGVLVTEDCIRCGGEGHSIRRLGSMVHNEGTPDYLSPGEGLWEGERLPPGRYRVGDDLWIEFDLRGEDALTNAVFIPEVGDWPFGEFPLNVLDPCPDCDGKGRRLRDGAECLCRSLGRNCPIAITAHHVSDRAKDRGYWFPASWLEGDGDE